MRKPPRPATLVLGLALVVLAIWRLFTWASSPPPALTSLVGSSSASASASAKSPSNQAPRRSEPAPPLALFSASAAPDEAAALGAFEGRVISSSTGRGIEGARVVLEHAGTANEVVCGALGAFRFVPSAPGAYALVHASADGHRSFAPEGSASPIVWTARPGARVSGFVLALDPRLTVTATVLDPAGKSVAGAEVRVIGSVDAAPAKKLVTDAKGEAKIDLDRDALVEARHPDFSPGRARVGLAVEASHEITIRLRSKGDRAIPEATGSIAGRVVGEGGAPIAGARVTAAIVVANRAAPGADLHPPGADVTETDGTFLLEGLDPGAYDLIASDDEHAPARAQGVATGATGVTLRLGDAGSLRGTVRDEAGKPVPAFSVVVTIPRGPLEKEHVATRSFLDAEGRYTIVGLGPGEYEIVALALGAAPSAIGRATIPDPPGAPVTVDLALAKGATLRGTVIDRETQKPVAGARVSLEGSLGTSDLPVHAAATTEADGSFELHGLAPGMRSLSVSAEGHHTRIVSGVAITEADPPPITIALTPTKKGEAPGIELVGIGAVLTAKDDYLLVGQAIPGGGAAEVGLTTGDAVLAIDGVKVTDLGFEGSIGRIRGPEGSTVVLTVRKAGATEAQTIPVPRRRIQG